ncbi:hypothetical protein PVAG01_01344 [Phlyctema vagabunda]|uniref:Uncharacterized protein n=1 Tax=Phlyctema vagabunda TaxID=108571 RepID=A0ABR4PX85_9HELO
MILLAQVARVAALLHLPKSNLLPKENVEHDQHDQHHHNISGLRLLALGLLQHSS